jgi:hypothetical protein
MNAQQKETMGNRNLKTGSPIQEDAAMNSVLKFPFFEIGICLEFSAYDLVLKSWNFFPAGSSGKRLVPNAPHLTSFWRPLVSFGVVSASFGRDLASVFTPQNLIFTSKSKVFLFFSLSASRSLPTST